MKTSLLLAGICSLVALNSCKKIEPVSEETSVNPLKSVLLTELPADAISVADAFANPTPGTPITVTGEIMGRMEPFIDSRAMVVLGDPTKITPCNRNHDDGCQTPWDVCCDDPEVIKTSTATIQILDENGSVIKEGLKWLGGMQELTTLTVVGEVAEGSNAENLLINASGIHVGSTDPFMTRS
ncbi:MAG: hypothetical protein ACSHYB_03220 [Roseibacillus sp.]